MFLLMEIGGGAMCNGLLWSQVVLERGTMTGERQLSSLVVKSREDGKKSLDCFWTWFSMALVALWFWRESVLGQIGSGGNLSWSLL